MAAQWLMNGFLRDAKGAANVLQSFFLNKQIQQ